MAAAIPGLEDLADDLTAAVRAGGGDERITNGVKRVLQERDRGLELPEALLQPLANRYTRRLLHRCPQGTYSLIAMTWGPSQGTPVHDHSGLWCVECVHEGAIDVVQYDLLERPSGDPTESSGGIQDLYQFAAQGRVRAERGSAGALIPPFEYHTIHNASDTTRAVTLHVYGGDLTECAIFEPARGGGYRRVVKPLPCD